MAQPLENREFTSVYPPDEFLRLFAPRASDALSRFSFRDAPSRVEDSLHFTRRKTPAWAFLFLIFFPIGLIFTLLIKETMTAQFHVTSYGSGSLVTVRSNDSDVLRLAEGIEVWR